MPTLLHVAALAVGFGVPALVAICYTRYTTRGGAMLGPKHPGGDGDSEEGEEGGP